MIPNLQFDFVVDREKNTLTMKREFAAERPLVWDCYSKSELLEQWFAPKPFTAKTKHMDFREGGYWLYAMIDPNGPEHWGRTDYVKIRPIENYQALDGFCDETGRLNPAFPQANWDVSFIELTQHSRVDTVITFQSLKDLETVIKMGMKDGMTSALERLDELLLSLQKEPA